MTTKHWILIFVGVLAVAVWPLFLGRFYAIGDMRDVFIPIENFYHTELLAGHLPSWWPDAAWGFPVIAAAQIGFFYPPLLVLRWLPLPIYFPIIFFTHLIALALGMWLFLRKLSFSSSAAYVGAVSLALSAFVWQHFTHLNILLALAWLPWQFLAVQYFLQYPSFKRKYFYYLALVLGLPFLVGQLQIPILMAIITSIYLILSHWSKHKQIKQPILIVTLLAVIAFGLAAAQLLPTAQLAQYSSRGGSGDYTLTQANQHSFPLYHLQTAVWPRFFGTDNTYWGKRLEIEYGFFIGTIPLLLALWASCKYYKQYKWWVWLGAISFLLALGDLSPFRLVGLEPSLWIFSAPARWLLFTTFAGSVLAAGGYDALLENIKAFQKVVRWALVAAVTIIVVGNIGIMSSDAILSRLTQNFGPDRDTTYYQQKFESLRHSLETSSVSIRSPYTWLPVAVLLISWWALRKKKMPVLLGTVTVELLLIAVTTTPTIPWSTVLNRPATVTTLPTIVQNRDARLLSLRPPGGDTGAWLTNPESRVDDIGREQQRQLLVPLTHTQFNILGAEWPASLDLNGQSAVLDIVKTRTNNELNLDVASQFNIGAIAELNTEGVVTVTPVKALPRASYQTDQKFDKSEQIIPALYTQVSPTHIAIKAFPSQAGWVVIRDTWFPDWHATVDGKSAPIDRAQNIFRAVPVAQGQSDIQLVYVPTMIYVGMGISLSTLVLLMVCLWWHSKRAISSHI